MDIGLIDRMICPTCRSELQWNVMEKHKNKIIEGYAECTRCKTIYPIQNGIALFLPAKWQNVKIWERSERVAAKKDKAEQVVENGNNEHPSEVLNMIRKRNYQGQVSNEDLYKHYMEIIGMPNTLHKLRCLAQKCADEAENVNYILDFASGRCLLANTLKESKSCQIIINDINPIIIAQSKKQFEKCDNVSFIVFDIKRSPFQNKSIHTITTMFGLQNIIPCKGIVEEINRIADVFLCISVFLTEEFQENVEVLNKYHIIDVWIKKRFDTLTEQFGWQGKQIYTILDSAKGISREEIETRFAALKFPVRDEIVEYNLTKYSIKCSADNSVFE